MENEFLFDDLEVQNNALPEGKSVDVFNALSLCDENLGKLYEDQGYNPYKENFVLTEEYANEILKNKKNALEISENFLEYSNKEVSKHFTMALENTQDIISALMDELSKTSDEKVKGQIEKTIVTLKNRNELLKLNIGKLKQKDANALRMYQELFGIDSELSELLRDTFNEKANAQIVLMQLMSLIRARASVVYTKAKQLLRQENENSVQEDIKKAIEHSQQQAQSLKQQPKSSQNEIQNQEEEAKEQSETKLQKREESKNNQPKQDFYKNDEEFTR
mgnify:FL=1